MFEVGVIPVAGQGLRLYPYTHNRPKTLLTVGDKSLLARNIAIMRDQFGVGRILLIVGHLHEQIRAEFGDGTAYNVQLEYIHCSDVEAGLARGLLQVKDKITGPFPVILGDELYLDSNHAEMAAAFTPKLSALCGIKLTGDTTLIRKNYAVELSDKRITRLIEKPEQINNPYLGLGSYIFTPAIFSAIEHCQASSRSGQVELTDVIQLLVDEQQSVEAFKLKGHYRNINYPEDYIAALNLYRKVHFAEYKVSVVIPTYNEATAIGHVVDDFLPHVDEVVVADNFSPDGSAEIARAHGARVVQGNYGGYGEAMRAALDAAEGDILIMMEGDGSFTADDLPKLLAYLRDADMAIGTRTTKQMIEQGANMDALLRWGNVIAAKLLQFLWISQEPRFTDLGCTYRGIWKESYQIIRPNLSGIGPEFSPEMMVEILRAERKVIEVPVTYRPRIGDISKHSGNLLAVAKTASRMLYLIVKRRLGLR